MPTTLVDQINGDNLLAKRAEETLSGVNIDDKLNELAAYHENHFNTEDMDKYRRVGVLLPPLDNMSDKVYAGAIFSVVTRNNWGINYQGFLFIRKWEYGGSSQSSFGNTDNTSRFIIMNDNNDYQTDSSKLPRFYTYVQSNTHNMEIWIQAGTEVGLNLINSSMRWIPDDTTVSEDTLPVGYENVSSIRNVVGDTNVIPFIGTGGNTTNYTTGIAYGDFYNSDTAIYGWKIGTTIETVGWGTTSFDAIVVVEDWTSNPEGPSNSRFIGTLEIFHRNNSSTPSQANTMYGARMTVINTTGYVCWVLYAKKTPVTNGYQIDWYIAKQSGTSGPEKSTKYSKITILPMVQLYGFTRKMERWTDAITMDDEYMSYVNVAMAGVGSRCQLDRGSPCQNGVYIDNGIVKEQKLKSVIIDLPCTNANTTGQALFIHKGSGDNNYSSFRIRTSVGRDLCDLTITAGNNFSPCKAVGYMSNDYRNIKPTIYASSYGVYIWWPTTTTGTSGYDQGNWKRIYVDLAYAYTTTMYVDVVDIPSSVSDLTVVSVINMISNNYVQCDSVGSGNGAYKEYNFRMLAATSYDTIYISSLMKNVPYFILCPATKYVKLVNDTGSVYTLKSDKYNNGYGYTMTATGSSSTCPISCGGSSSGVYTNRYVILVHTDIRTIWAFYGYNAYGEGC